MVSEIEVEIAVKHIEIKHPMLAKEKFLVLIKLHQFLYKITINCAFLKRLVFRWGGEGKLIFFLEILKRQGKEKLSKLNSIAKV